MGRNTCTIYRENIRPRFIFGPLALLVNEQI